MREEGKGRLTDYQGSCILSLGSEQRQANLWQEIITNINAITSMDGMKLLNRHFQAEFKRILTRTKKIPIKLNILLPIKYEIAFQEASIS